MHQARATRDVDVVVGKVDHKKALQAIRQQFPDLVIDDQTVVTRLIDPENGEAVVNLMRPMNVFRHVFDNAVLTDAGHQVPNLEMAIASKLFSALASRNRPEEKLHLDASDFIQMVKRNHERLDRDRLRQLGDAVYSGGGEELSHRIEDVLAGRRLRI